MNDVDAVIQEICRRLNMKFANAARRFELDYFTYTHSYLPATASVVTTTNFLVQADSGFAIVKTMAIISDTSDAFVANLSDTPKFWPFLVTWTDSGSGRDLMDAAVALENVVGTGQRPYYWPKPKILDPNSTFVGRLQNLSATDRRVRLAFGGFKIFGDVGAFKGRR